MWAIRAAKAMRGAPVRGACDALHAEIQRREPNRIGKSN